MCNMVKLLIITTDPHIPDTVKSPCTHSKFQFYAMCLRSSSTQQSSHSFCLQNISGRRCVSYSKYDQWLLQSGERHGIFSLPMHRTAKITCKTPVSSIFLLQTSEQTSSPASTPVFITHFFVHLTEICDIILNPKVQVLSFKLIFMCFNFELSLPKPFLKLVSSVSFFECIKLYLQPVILSANVPDFKTRH